MTALLPACCFLILTACGNGASLLASPEIAVEPEPRATGVVVTAAMQATFREPMDPLSINETSFSVIDGSRRPVPGTVSYDGATNTATFTPQADLAPDTLYTSTLSSDIRTVSGRASTEFVWSFRTTPIIFRVSLDAGGEEGTGASRGASLSGSGRFVGFISDAVNLVSGDSNGVSDLFLKDIQSGSVELLSRNAAGDPGAGQTTAGAVSEEAAHGVFASEAPDLIADDSNGVVDIFRRNVETGEVERASIPGTGEQAQGASLAPAISGTGRYVAFESDAANLVAGDGNGVRDVFRKDLFTGRLQRVSTSTAGGEANAASGAPAISADGRFVAFRSFATNLTPQGTNGFPGIFLKDMDSGELIRVSEAADGTGADGPSDEPAVSADGRFVAFSSQAGNLVDTDLNGVTDVFLKDLQTGEIIRVSEGAGGEPGDSASVAPDLSADGQYVVFESRSTNLVPGDTNGQRDIFIRDTQGSAIIRVSPPAGGQSDRDSFLPSISADGRYVAFHSEATNIVDDDANAVGDVFAALNLLTQPAAGISPP